jgi:hypothetical protein
MANAPLWDGMAGILKVIWVGPKQIYFSDWDWTGGLKLNSLGNSLFSRNAS